MFNLGIFFDILNLNPLFQYKFESYGTINCDSASTY